MNLNEQTKIHLEALAQGLLNSQIECLKILDSSTRAYEEWNTLKNSTLPFNAEEQVITLKNEQLARSMTYWMKIAESHVNLIKQIKESLL
jgi:hypothetical protein